MKDKANKIHHEWCTRACKYIRHPADRREVLEELEGHFQDRISALTETGMRYSEARKQTEAAMGDPDEVGRLLGQIHTPWMSYLLTLSKWICAFLILFGIFHYGHFSIRLFMIYLEHPEYRSEWHVAEDQYDHYAAAGVTQPVKTGAEAQVGAYRFKLIKGEYLQNGSVVLLIEIDRPFGKAAPDRFLKEARFRNANGLPLKGSCSTWETDGWAVCRIEDAWNTPVILTIDYAGKGFTWVIEPDAEVMP